MADRKGDDSKGEGAPSRWYEDGLPFACTACGNCCRTHGDYSHVYVREDEVAAIASHLGRDPLEFLATDLVVDDGWITLRPDLPQCQFLTAEGRCGIYPVRPVQCRTWPFWDVNLEPKVWRDDVNRICPGSRSGTPHDADRIDAIARATEDWYDDRISEWDGRMEPHSEAEPESESESGPDNPPAQRPS